MKSFVYTVLLMTLSSGLIAQSNEAFTFQGQVFEMNLRDSVEKPISGIPIEVWYQDELLTSLNSGSKGKYKINLKRYPSYRIKFGKAPYTSKIIDIDAKGFDRAAEFGMVNLQLDVVVFKEENMMGMDFMNYTPFAIAKFNKKRGTMEWDFDYSEKMAKRVQGIIEANKYPTTRMEK